MENSDSPARVEGINDQKHKYRHGYAASSQPVTNVKEVQVINGDGPPDLFQHVEHTVLSIK